MTATVDIRLIDPAEFLACEQMKAELFGIPFPPHRLAEVRSVRELDRTYVACSGPALVGSITANSFTMAVPGGTARTAGLSGLGLRPEFDGVPQRLALLARQLEAARERCEPLAALCTLLDVPPVYDQAGFAVASRGLDVEIESGHAGMTGDAGRAEPAREVSPGELRATAERCYQQLAASVPGVIQRSHAMWDRWAAKNIKAGVRCLVAGPGEQPLGYAVAAGSAGTGQPAWSVRELGAVTPLAALALWSAIFAGGGTVRAAHRPSDDPLQWLLTDPRKLHRSVAEGIWVRLVDVPAALSARRWSCAVDVVLRVRDRTCGWNDGTYRLTAGPDGAACTPSTADPGVSIDVRALGAAYLGSTRLSALAGTGLVTATAGQLHALDTALSWPQTAWAPTRF